jgi:hypothetical protein
MRTAAEILHEHGIITLRSAAADGRHYTTCPQCSAGRQRAHQKLKCLGITIDTTGVGFRCLHCDWSGGGFYEQEKRHSEPARHVPGKDNTGTPQATDKQRAKAQRLWRHSLPAAGTIAEHYLRSRGITAAIPATIRFLPPFEPEHHPALIAAFGIPAEREPGMLPNTWR